MSVRVMTAVFERYPSGGGEMVLALALADHAHDDGSHIFPSVAALAEKTRQSQRTVQYQLRKMEADGWLVLIGAGDGGRGRSREYRISGEWIKGEKPAPRPAEEKGANPAPFADEEKGAIHDIKGAIHDIKGAIHDIKGCNGLHPHITIKNHQEPSEKHQPRARARAGAGAPDLSDIPADLLADFRKVRSAKRAPLTHTAVNGMRREAQSAGVTLADAMRICCERGWQSFRADWLRAEADAPPARASPRKPHKHAAAAAVVFGRPQPSRRESQHAEVIDV